MLIAGMSGVYQLMLPGLDGSSFARLVVWLTKVAISAAWLVISSILEFFAVDDVVKLSR